MTLQALLNIIGSIGIEDKLINFAGAGGSIYEINDLTIRDYPILYVSPTGTHRVEENFTSYQLTIFYIDRLLEDNSNGTNIHSTGVEVLKNIIRKVATLDGVISVSDEYTINLFTETERMKDRCNGSYATLEITVLNDYICADYEGGSEGHSGGTEYFRFINEDREYVSSGETEYTVRWQTTAQSVRYYLSGATGEESGTTTDKQLTFDMGLNMEDAAQRFDLSVWAQIEGRERMYDLRWYHNPLWFIRFNPDVAFIGSAVTAYTAEFETNTKPTYKWELVDNNSSVIISSGVSEEKRINLEFDPWIGGSDERVLYLTVFGRDSEGGAYTSESGQMWIMQERLVPEFEFVTPDNQTIGYTATAYTVSWNTNISKLIWKSTGAASTPSSGISTTSAVTVTFPKNYTESGLNRTIEVYYTKSTGAEVLLGTRSWSQEHVPAGDVVNTAITSDYTVGLPVKDIDEIVPYGYYIMRWEKAGTYGKLTRELDNVYVTDRYMSGFVDGNVQEGVLPAQNAQRIRILQAIPKEDVPELSNATLYLYDPDTREETVYTGASYLFYDIYVQKYVSWLGGSGFEHRDVSVFADAYYLAPLVWNILKSSADGNKIGMSGANVRLNHTAMLPMKRVYLDENCMTGTEQRSESAYPYNYPHEWDWNDVKVTIIPITEIP